MNVVNVLAMAACPPAPPPAHLPVLAREVTRLIAPAGAVIVDATIGAGGHAQALLEAGARRVVGLDRDPDAIEIARRRLHGFGDRVVLRQAAFSEISGVIGELGIGPVDGLLADLGVSSMQLDRPERGMSFRAQGPLDMRMDPSRGPTAAELIEASSDEDLAELLWRLGEERRARRIARCIKQELARGSLHTTLDLRRAVVRAVGPARVGGVDPATRTFQALRMAVNGEIDELQRLLTGAPAWLRQGGVIAVISFHSLEDRMVKRSLAAPAWWPLTRKPIQPGEAEIEANPRARSAKLRAARRAEQV